MNFPLNRIRCMYFHDILPRRNPTTVSTSMSPGNRSIRTYSSNICPHWRARCVPSAPRCHWRLAPVRSSVWCLISTRRWSTAACRSCPMPASSSRCYFRSVNTRFSCGRDHSSASFSRRFRRYLKSFCLLPPSGSMRISCLTCWIPSDDWSSNAFVW